MASSRDEEQRQEFDRFVATEPYQGVQAMNVTWFEKGMEKGMEKGRREALRELLEERFGPLSEAVLQRLEQVPAGRLNSLLRAALRAQSLRELGLDD